MNYGVNLQCSLLCIHVNEVLIHDSGGLDVEFGAGFYSVGGWIFVV